MKVYHGKITKLCQNEEDLEFRGKLKIAMENWYQLKLEDLPNIINLIGIKNLNYEIIFKYEDYIFLSFIVKTKDTEVEIELSKKKIIYPEPTIKVITKQSVIKFFTLDELKK
ncbi:MAG: hypothetical protein GX682_01840 [Clostridiaceae bacterium]|nr:hypothetical protein [Clostridiaceae bacterium]